MFNLADHPCHGTHYYSNEFVKRFSGADRWPGGDKHGRMIPHLLGQLRIACGVATYHFRCAA